MQDHALQLSRSGESKILGISKFKSNSKGIPLFLIILVRKPYIHLHIYVLFLDTIRDSWL